MLILFVFLVLCNFCSGDYAVKCGERDGLSLEETQDGVEGRYKLEWCTQQYFPIANWSWTLYSGDDGDPDNCNQKYFDRHEFHKHSFNVEPIKIDLNCTQSVCLSTTLDLIFNSTCYKVQPNLRRTKPNSSNTQSCCIRSYVQYVYNNYSKEYFTKSESRVKVYPTGDHVTVDWFHGHIPFSVYFMDVCWGNKTIEENCTRLGGEQCVAGGGRRTRLRCALRPPRGAYVLRLRHAAPWSSGTTLFEDLVYTEHHSSVQPSPQEVPALAVGGAGGAWWAGALALALGGAGAVAAALLCRSALLRSARKPVDTIWKNRRLAASEVTAGETKAPVAEPPQCAQSPQRAQRAQRGRVLVLYARDCAPLMEVARALSALLVAAGFQVYDVYSAEVMAAAARAPGEWVRGVLARPDVRALLLQTPAARSLHHAALSTTTNNNTPAALLQLEQPLLNRRVMYRRPHAGDALFLLALRLLADAALTSQDYRKYYVATIESLEVELVAEVTPLQRYSLPAAAALLLRDLAAPAPSAPAPPASAPPVAPAPPPSASAPAAPAAQLARLVQSVAQLHAYIRDKPDYLDDELIFFDYDT